MNKLINKYYSLYNNINGLLVNADILDFINIIDEIGFEQFMLKQIYISTNNKIKLNKESIDYNIYILRLNLNIDSICTFIMDNISFNKFNKIGLYGFICYNKYDEKILNIIDDTNNNILIILLNKIYSEFMVEQIKDIIKIYLQSLNIDIDYDNFNSNFDKNVKIFIDHLKNNNKKYINDFKDNNEQFNNDMKLLNQTLFNI